MTKAECGQLKAFLDRNDFRGVATLIGSRDRVGLLQIPIPQDLFFVLKIQLPKEVQITPYMPIVAYAVLKLCTVEIIKLLLRGFELGPGAFVDAYKRSLLHYLACSRVDASDIVVADVYNFLRPTCTTWNSVDARGNTAFSLGCYNYNLSMMKLLASELTDDRRRKVDILLRTAPFDNTAISSVIQSYKDRKKPRDESTPYDVISTIIRLVTDNDDYSVITSHLLSVFAKGGNVIVYAVQNNMTRVVELLLDTVMKCRIIKLDEFISTLSDSPLFFPLCQKEPNFRLFSILIQKAHCSPLYCSRRGKFDDIFQVYKKKYLPTLIQQETFNNMVRGGPDCQWPQKQGTLNPREQTKLITDADSIQLCYDCTEKNNIRGNYKRLALFVQETCLRVDCHPFKLVIPIPEKFRKIQFIPSNASMPLTSLFHLAVMNGCDLRTIKMLAGEGLRLVPDAQSNLFPPPGELRDFYGRVPMHYLAMYNCNDPQEKSVKIDETYRYLMGTQGADGVHARTKATDYWEISPFMLAMFNGQWELVQRLLKDNIDPDGRNFNGINPILAGAIGLKEAMYTDDRLLIANMNAIVLNMLEIEPVERIFYMYLDKLGNPLLFMARNGQLNPLKSAVTRLQQMQASVVLDDLTDLVQDGSLLLTCTRQLNAGMYVFLATSCGVSPYTSIQSKGSVHLLVKKELKEMKKKANPERLMAIRQFEQEIKGVDTQTLANPRRTVKEEEEEKRPPLEKEQPNPMNRKTEVIEEETMVDQQQPKEEEESEATRVQRNRELNSPGENDREDQEVIDYFQDLLDTEGNRDQAVREFKQTGLPVDRYIDIIRKRHAKTGAEMIVAEKQMVDAYEILGKAQRRWKDVSVEYQPNPRIKGATEARIKRELQEQQRRIKREMAFAETRKEYYDDRFQDVRIRLSTLETALLQWVEFKDMVNREE